MLIFYSRPRDKAKELAEFCQKNNYDLIAQSLISFKEVPFELPKKSFNVVFFTSPRSVDFFLQSAKLAPNMQIACIGSSTAKHLTELGFKVNFMGKNSAEPQQVAEDFQSWLGSKTVLFPISDQSNRSISKVLSDGQFTEVIVYKTLENSMKITPKPDVLVFSSPSNARAFFKKNTIHIKQIVCSFGRTTHNFLITQNIYSELLEEPSEEAVIAFLQKTTLKEAR